MFHDLTLISSIVLFPEFRYGVLNIDFFGFQLFWPGDQCNDNNLFATKQNYNKWLWQTYKTVNDIRIS